MKVLLVDDHKLFLDSLASLLMVSGINVVGTARDGLEALQKARELKPDIVVMDIQMPRCDGLTATRLLKTEMPEVKVVMLTMTETDRLLLDALKSGASGYVLKNLDGADFISTLYSLAKGELAASVDFPAYDRICQQLTPRQLEVLTLVASGMGYKEVATILNLSERTIKYHMNEIITKLQLASRTEAIALARRIGLSSKD